MTPFTADQLAAVLAAAEPLGQRAFSELDLSDQMGRLGFPEPARHLGARGLIARMGFKALVRLAWAGLPADLALEVRQQQIDGDCHPLLRDVLEGRLPPGAIVDLVREFLARPGQPEDVAIGVTGTAFTVLDQPAFNQASLHEQGHVLGEDSVLHQSFLVEELSVRTGPGAQEQGAD